MKYFVNVETIDELKRQYKTLAFKHHPDRGGKVEDMQAINAEYDALFECVKNVHETANGIICFFAIRLRLLTSPL